MAEPNPKIITLRDNPVRWVLFSFLLGLIVGLLITFVEESLFPLPLPRLAKACWVLAVGPTLVTVLGVWMKRRLENPPDDQAAESHPRSA